MARDDQESWTDPEDLLIPLAEVSESLREALRQRPTPGGYASARARARDGKRYRASCKNGKVWIERSPSGCRSLPLPEPPSLHWVSETPYSMQESAGEGNAGAGRFFSRLRAWGHRLMRRISRASTEQGEWRKRSGR